MSYFEIIIKLLPEIAKVLLGAAAVITAWKGRHIAKEKTREKRKDQ